MRHAYPLFLEGHILRKEMLETLSDYAILWNEVLYPNFSNGILCGCELTTTEEEIWMGRGIVCLFGQFYLIKEALSVAYVATDTLCSCQLCFSEEIEVGRERRREITLQLQKGVENKEEGREQLELARFRLQPGARLRDTYTNFEDRCTEYDTLNGIHAPFAARGGATLSLPLLRAFVEELQQIPERTDLDVLFSIQVKSLTLPLPGDAIADYLRQRRREEVDATTPGRLYAYLALLLSEIKEGKQAVSSTKKRNRWQMQVE